MAHKVTLELPKTRQVVTVELPTTHVVLHKDIKVQVHSTVGKLGTVLISKGNIEWLASPKSLKKHRLSWIQFAALMEAQGKPARAAKRPTKK